MEDAAQGLAFVHTVVHELTGLKPIGDDDVVLVDAAEKGIWACITRDPSEYCADADLGAAVGTMLLRFLGGGGPQGTPEERLAEEVKLAREQREGRGRARTYLVVRRQGSTAPFPPDGAERELGDIVIRINGGPAAEIGAETKRVTAALALALSIESDHAVSVRSYASSVVYIRADGKRVFAKQMGGSATATVWKPMPENLPAAIPKTFGELNGLEDLGRVLNLFAASLETSDDRLRSFQSGWAALEIFVNKVFLAYEHRFFEDLTGDAQALAHGHYVGRIQKVMQDKYRLTDKFAIIASTLAPESADADLEVFGDAKQKRDDLSHGQEADESALPVGDVHNLLKRYLHLHSQKAW